MFRPLYSFLFCFLFLACNAPTAPALNYDLEGKVVKIADGDTFTLLTEGNKQERIRLHGIDCPERKQDYGTRAQQLLSSLVFGKHVQVERKDTDRYGRIVGIAYVDGKVVNEELLREGLAWHYTEYDDNPRWAELQEEARRNRRGLWEQPNPTPPWEYRKERRRK